MYSPDKTDQRILMILQNRGRLANQEVAERAGISAAACWRRIKALEEKGIISRYAALLDRNLLDLKLCSFVHVSLARHETENIKAFEKLIEDREEILECHATTGDADFLLKVITRDIEHFDCFLKEDMFTLPGILQVRSNIALREIKSDTRLPVQRG